MGPTTMCRQAAAASVRSGPPVSASYVSHTHISPPPPFLKQAQRHTGSMSWVDHMIKLTHSHDLTTLQACIV
jgi:hypothetical protein